MTIVDSSVVNIFCLKLYISTSFSNHPNFIVILCFLKSVWNSNYFVTHTVQIHLLRLTVLRLNHMTLTSKKLWADFYTMRHHHKRWACSNRLWRSGSWIRKSWFKKFRSIRILNQRKLTKLVNGESQKKKMLFKYVILCCRSH